MAVLQRGDSGPGVAEIRSILIAQRLLDDRGQSSMRGRHRPDGHGPDATFDSTMEWAIKEFQQQRGLIVDGVVGDETYRALHEASYRFGARNLLFRANQPMHGDDVSTLQSRLLNLGFYTGRIDGAFGPSTHTALVTYQREFGLVPDGICGPDTLRAIGRIPPRASGGSPHAIREHEYMRDSGPRLSGKRVIVDPGLGPAGSPLTQFGSDVLWDIATRLEGRMAAAGMETYFSRGRDQFPTESQRANFANSLDADLLISLRVAAFPNPRARGVATFHFGNRHGSSSAVGESLAQYIQREIVARTGMQDCRWHPGTWDILRLTQMATVQIDVGYVTNDDDVHLLSDPGVRDDIAMGILAAVKRTFLLGKDDQPTGTYTFADLLAGG